MSIASGVTLDDTKLAALDAFTRGWLDGKSGDQALEDAILDLDASIQRYDSAEQRTLAHMVLVKHREAMRQLSTLARKP